MSSVFEGGSGSDFIWLNRFPGLLSVLMTVTSVLPAVSVLIWSDKSSFPSVLPGAVYTYRDNQFNITVENEVTVCTRCERMKRRNKKVSLWLLT